MYPGLKNTLESQESYVVQKLQSTWCVKHTYRRRMGTRLSQKFLKRGEASLLSYDPTSSATDLVLRKEGGEEIDLVNSQRDSKNVKHITHNVRSLKRWEVTASV